LSHNGTGNFCFGPTMADNFQKYAQKTCAKNRVISYFSAHKHTQSQKKRSYNNNVCRAQSIFLSCRRAVRFYLDTSPQRSNGAHLRCLATRSAIIRTKP
jgi:hypothetical protein